MNESNGKKQTAALWILGVLVVILIAVIVALFIMQAQTRNKELAAKDEKIEQIEQELTQVKNQLQQEREVYNSQNNTINKSSNTNNANINVTSEELKTKFSYSDLIVNDLKYGMTQQEVIDIMGEPDSKEEPNGPNIYGEDLDYIYGDLRLEFLYHDGVMKLSGTSTKSSKYTFCKGLKVGDTKEKVLNSFYKEADNERDLRDAISKTKYTGEETKYTETTFGKILYGNLIDVYDDDANNRQTENVEYAVINYSSYDANKSESTYMINYYYSEPPYINGYAQTHDVHGSLVFDVSSQDIITCIRWYFYPEVKD